MVYNDLSDQFVLNDEGKGDYSITYKDHKFLIDEEHHQTLVIPYSSLKEAHPNPKELEELVSSVNGSWYEDDYLGDANDTEEVINDEEIDESELQLWVDLNHWYSEKENTWSENVLSEEEDDALYSTYLGVSIETYKGLWNLDGADVSG